MFNLLGVSICIACLSYLCCIYTTFAMLSDPSDSQVKRKCTRCPPSVTPERSPQESVSTKGRCPCFTARYTQRQQLSDSAIPNRKKVCLVASSFFNFDDTEPDSARINKWQ
ncbi:PREDICTED: uncharacterized protein LOC105368383 [Ceratosolen solmsi marchali]|uniref:Uncharacterized protein LOC105368383 n=1 Tax=Ceratosolen solmsi marchali TaxID=326594 RepID=A0AAJ6YWH6_9HYME|nr:PREDICTED: uncharacterized protein LOC105368383 [Ceratosolen solmsi marchali]